MASSPGEQKFPPLAVKAMELLMSGRGIRTEKRKPGIRQAGEAGHKKGQFFRGKDFQFTMKWRLRDPKYVAVIGPYLDPELDLSVPLQTKHIAQLATRLMQDKLISQAEWYNPTKQKAKSWPDKLVRTEQMSYKDDVYYIVNYEKKNPYQSYYVAALIICPVLVVMFPVWPLWLKIGIWYSLVAWLGGLIAFINIRVGIALVFWVAGYDFWILPNVFDETVGWVEGLCLSSISPRIKTTTSHFSRGWPYLFSSCSVSSRPRGRAGVSTQRVTLPGGPCKKQ